METKTITAFLTKFLEVRNQSELICAPLQVEDYVVQPIVDVSPPKWHLGHTTWFFEAFILIPYYKDYKVFDPNFNYIFNSYYETVGARVIRTDRGNLTRPTVAAVYEYRKHVDRNMSDFLSTDIPDEILPILDLGLNHEQQHQELLLTDIKYILGHNPLFPAYDPNHKEKRIAGRDEMISFEAGIYNIGFDGDGFCFDNELSRHKVWIESFKISASQITNAEYREFIDDGGYQNFRFWHAEGWDWINREKIVSPMYWHKINGSWHSYELSGLQKLEDDLPVKHISFYEASAFAAWKGMRLPTEAEWETANAAFDWGNRWEWTQSAYLPYPGFRTAPGAIGEYNGKFMINQMVLRGASVATPSGHSRTTYRNFFHPHLRWQFTGIRLAESI